MRGKKTVTPPPVGGKRRLNVPTRQDRIVLLRRQQIAGQLLVFGYWAAFALSLIGVEKSVSHFQGAGGEGTDATGYILGFVTLAGTVVWGVLTAWAATKLTRDLALKRVHFIRRWAFATFACAVGVLCFMAWRVGNPMMASVSMGLITVFLVLFSMIALAAYGANRSLKE